MPRAPLHTRTKVLNLCVIAWQAIAAVVSPPDNGPVLNTAERVNSVQEKKDAETGSSEEGANDHQPRGTKVQGSLNGDGKSGSRDHVAEDAVLLRDSGGGKTSVSNCDASTVDALRDLVRCLCGVVVGRWKQASTTTAKAPKKVWVVHAMEAVHALVRTLEVGWVRCLW